MTILITKEEYNKIGKNHNNKLFQFTINSTQKEHTCNSKEITEIVDVAEIKTKEQEKELAIFLN